MKKGLPILCLILLMGAASCRPQAAEDFGIYLLAQDRPATEVVGSEIGTLELQQIPLIDTGDIVAYDRLTHEIQLTSDAFRRVQAIFPLPVRVDGIPFVVRVGEEPIYGGAFWTPLSSLSFDGVVIMQPFGEEEKIRLSLGYPGSFDFSDKDPRADARILSALEQAGKLR